MNTKSRQGQNSIPRNGKSGNGCRRPKHIHRPAAEPGMFNPCARYHVTTDDMRCLPKEIAGHKTPRAFWDTVVVMAQLSQDDRPCYGGLKDLCRATFHTRATFCKHRKLSQTLGMFELVPRGGIGKGRLTTLCRPKDSSLWRYFRSKAEFNSDAKHLTVYEVKCVKSVPNAQSKAALDRTEPTPPISAHPIDTEHTVQENQAEKPAAAAAVWSVAIFIALIARIVGWSIRDREAQSIIKTIHNKGLSIHSPERVVYAIRDDLTYRGGFQQFRPELIHNPGGTLNAAAQHLEPEHVAEVNVPRLAASGTGDESVPASPASDAAPYYRPYKLKKKYACERCQDSGWEQIEERGFTAARKCDHAPLSEEKPPG